MDTHVLVEDHCELNCAPFPSAFSLFPLLSLTLCQQRCVLCRRGRDRSHASRRPSPGAIQLTMIFNKNYVSIHPLFPSPGCDLADHAANPRRGCRSRPS
jgi:hypothetical protein